MIDGTQIRTLTAATESKSGSGSEDRYEWGTESGTPKNEQRALSPTAEIWTPVGKLGTTNTTQKPTKNGRVVNEESTNPYILLDDNLTDEDETNMLGPSIVEIVHTKDLIYNYNILGSAIEELTDVKSNLEHINNGEDSIE